MSPKNRFSRFPDCIWKCDFGVGLLQANGATLASVDFIGHARFQIFRFKSGNLATPNRGVSSLRGRRRLNQIDEKFCKFLTIGQACLQRFPASARSDWSRGWAVQELHLILHVTVSFPPKAGSRAMRNRALAQGANPPETVKLRPSNSIQTGLRLRSVLGSQHGILGSRQWLSSKFRYNLGATCRI